MAQKDGSRPFIFDLSELGSHESKLITTFASKKVLNSAKVTLADMGYGSIAIFAGLGSLLLCSSGFNADFGTTRHSSPSEGTICNSRILLIEVVTERKLQILVESHSEHLLTRLQLGIAERKNFCTMRPHSIFAKMRTEFLILNH